MPNVNSTGLNQAAHANSPKVPPAQPKATPRRGGSPMKINPPGKMRPRAPMPKPRRGRAPRMKARNLA